MNSDSPIRQPSRDKFGYFPLATQVAPLLLVKSQAPSLVAGVESPWGSGKTSFLNLIRHVIEHSHRDALVLEYHPWLYSTVDALLLGFCVQVASQLQGKPGHKYDLASKAFASLSQVFGKLKDLPDGYGVAATAVAAGAQGLASSAESIASLTEIDLSNAQERVQKAIDGTNRPIVIIIDDVDRLAPEEIRLLFQFLKAVADFRGVSYLLAYDPKPVEYALSYGGDLKGREYLKKFIQLPLRLPRTSNLLLQRFFEDGIGDISKDLDPPLATSEKAELRKCARLPVFLQAFKTPRDAVRLLNSFRLRLTDCRNEISLDQLLLFVMLDLVSPDAVDLVRQNPDLFLLPFATHPEFEVHTRESHISRLMSEQKEKAEARDEKVATLPSDEQAIARKLINHLFEPKQNHRSEYDVRHAQTDHGLIKLLYGGTSSLSFSRKDSLAFLAGKSRKKILGPIKSSGVLKQWIVFLSSVDDNAPVRNAPNIAKLLINAVKHETGDTWDDSLRLVSDYLAELLLHLPGQSERQALIREVISQGDVLFISEHLLAKLATGAGLWKAGKSIDVSERVPVEPDQVDPQHILEAEKIWLTNVRSAAAQGTLDRQAHLASILHRWGQFNSNDYSEVQDYFKQFCVRQDPLVILRRFALGTSLDGLERIVVDPQTTREALSRFHGEKELRAEALKAMQLVDKKLHEASQTKTAA